MYITLFVSQMNNLISDHTQGSLNILTNQKPALEGIILNQILFSSDPAVSFLSFTTAWCSEIGSLWSLDAPE